MLINIYLLFTHVYFVSVFVCVCVWIPLNRKQHTSMFSTYARHTFTCDVELCILVGNIQIYVIGALTKCEITL